MLHAIKLPRTQADLEATAMGFEFKSKTEHFGKVVGLIDSTHIRIVVPKWLQKLYFNQKHFYSIQLQEITDSDGSTDRAFAGYSSSWHDSFLL